MAFYGPLQYPMNTNKILLLLLLGEPINFHVTVTSPGPFFFKDVRSVFMYF